MQLVVLASDDLKEELLQQGTNKEVDFAWINHVKEFKEHQNADGYLDLLFDNKGQDIDILKSLSKPVIINSVIHTLPAEFIRINAWPGFLKRNIVEACCSDENLKEEAEKIFLHLNRRIEWLPDEPGFISARVIAMIINEAWFALAEGVSSKEEINTAMKLGTNYPYGPFEWCNKIGTRNIYALLSELSIKNTRYKPASWLEKEALA